MNRWLVGGVLAILLSSFGVLLATPQPVQACSCVVFTPPEQLEMASTVFAVGIGGAAVAGVAFAITWARRRGKFSV